MDSKKIVSILTEECKYGASSYDCTYSKETVC